MLNRIVHLVGLNDEITIDFYVCHSFVRRLKRVYLYTVTTNCRPLCISVKAYYFHSVRPSVCLSVCI